MHLGTYTFTGDPGELLAAYDRLMAQFPSSALLWHLCVATDTGMVIYDTCPSSEDFRAFSTDPTVRASMRASGLPEPQVQSLGDVHNAVANAALAGH